MELVHFETLGCKLNQIETESAAAAFRAAGFAIDGAEIDVPSQDTIDDTSDEATNEASCDSEGEAGNTSADASPGAGLSGEAFPILCIVNTCTVTGKAEQKARRLIRLLLRTWPQTPVLVTGCYAEVEAPAIQAIDPRVLVLPGSRKDELADLPAFLANALALRAGTDVADVLRGFLSRRTDGDGHFRLATDNFLFHSRGSIKIQDGCNNRCAYCRICLARGKSVSLPADEAVARVQEIEKAGWPEVVITGVNLGQYRSGSEDFAHLLGRLLAETERISIRISSLYPERVDEALLPLLANKRVAPHFHLSVQSGSDRILSAMHRPYTAQTVRDAVRRLREIKDDPFLACDIIAGFPGESDEDFAATLELCGESRFAWIHAFPFSPRPGTEAWGMRPRVPERVAGERVAALTDLAERGRREYCEAWIGREVSAISESGGGPGSSRALTENYLSVSVDEPDIPRGRLIRVRITGIGTATLVSRF